MNNVLVSGYVMKNGMIIIFFTINGEFVNVTSIITTPVFYVNNSLITVQGPFWTNKNLNCPWVIYQPQVSILETDEVIVITVANWCTVNLKNAIVPAQNNVILNNYFGQLEPSVGTYGGVTVPGFNNNPNTLKLGINNSWGADASYFASYFPFQNALLRSDQPLGILTSDVNGHPLTISNTITFEPVLVNQGGAIDARGIPTTVGVYQFIATENNPLTPMTVSAKISGSGINISPVTLINKTNYTIWEWTVSYTNPSNPTNFYYGIVISVIPNSSNVNSNGGFNYTLSNEKLLTPGNIYNPNNTNPYPIDDNFSNRVTTANGKTPAFMRFIDSVGGFGYSNAVQPTDLMSPAYWLWGKSTNKTFNILTIQNFNVINSPYIYWSQNWPNSLPIGTPSALYALPTSPGILNFSGSLTGWYMLECIYDNSIVQLQSGQVITFGTITSIPCSNGNGANVTVNPSYGQCSVFMTAPNKFICTLWGGIFVNTIGMPGGINNIIGINNDINNNINQNWTANLTCPDSSSIGYGPSASIVGQLPNTNYWANLPVRANDSLVKTIINDILSNLPVGRNIVIECGNELWNYGLPDYFTMYVISQSIGTINNININSHGQVAVLRAAEMHNICYDAALAVNRGSSIKRSFGSQYSYPAITTQIIQTINTWNSNPLNNNNLILMDSVHVAPYLDAPNDSTLVWACASIYSINVNSIAYNTPFPWTRGQYWDMFRHYQKYNTFDNGPTGCMAAHKAALATYIPVGGQSANFVPALITYEGGINAIPPIGVSTQSNPTNFNNMVYQLSHDLLYDPGVGDYETTCYQSWQFGGISLALVYCLSMERAFETTYVYNWAQYIWDNQQPGDGTNNQFYAVTGQSQDYTNASVRGWAWREWVSQAN
jgi:hypothetical protein